MACATSIVSLTYKKVPGYSAPRSSIYKLQAVAHAPSQLARLLVDSCSDLEELDSWEPNSDRASSWFEANNSSRRDDQFNEGQEQCSTAEWFQSVSAALPGCGSHTAPLHQLTAAGCYVLHGPAKVTKLSSGLLKAELLPGAWLDIDDVDTPSTQLSLHMEVASSDSSSDELPKVIAADNGSLKLTSLSPSPSRTFQHHHPIPGHHATVTGSDTGLPRTWETITAAEPTTCLLVGEHVEIQGGFQLKLHPSNDQPEQFITLIVQPDAKPAAGDGAGHETGVMPGQEPAAVTAYVGSVAECSANNTPGTVEHCSTEDKQFQQHPPGSSSSSGDSNGHGCNHIKRDEYEVGVVAVDKSSRSPSPAASASSCEEGVLHAHGHVLLKVHALPTDHSWCLELPQGSVISHPLNVCPDTWHTS